MEEKINELCEEYGFVKGVISGYRGGYPIVVFTVAKESGIDNVKQKEFDKYIRKAELKAGMEMGVGFNFRRTGFVQLSNNELVVCGHILVIEKTLQHIFQK